MTATVAITIIEVPKPTAILESDDVATTQEQRLRSKNASAQAKHRAKRKAYIKQLEDTVAKLEALLSQGTEKLTPYAQTRIHELEEENSRLKDKIDMLSVRLDQYPYLPLSKTASCNFASSSRNRINVAFPSEKVPTINNDRPDNQFPVFDPVSNSNDKYSSAGDLRCSKRRKLVSTNSDSESSETTSYLTARETGPQYREVSLQPSHDHYSGQTNGATSNVHAYPLSSNRTEAHTRFLPSIAWPSPSFAPSQELSDSSLPASPLTHGSSSATHPSHIKDHTDSIVSTLTELTNVMTHYEMESSTSATTNQFTMSLSHGDYAPLQAIY